MKLLTKEEIIAATEEITDCSNKSEQEIDRLIDRLEEGVPDPQISDYIYWSEMTAEKIADIALQYKPIVL